MRVLGSAVLVMEAFIMGFALLLAKDGHGGLALALGGILAVAFILTAGIMKKKTGWYVGSVLQIALIAYGIVVPAMYAMGALFTALWIAAYVVGKKGEAIRAALLAEKAKKEGQN